jgi:hypothetical protein
MNTYKIEQYKKFPFYLQNVELFLYSKDHNIERKLPQ